MIRSKKHVYAVVSYKEDEHLPYVERHLDSPFVLLDLSTNYLKKNFTFRQNRGSFVLFLNGEPLTDITSVWYRRMIRATEKDLPIVNSQRPYSVKSLFNFANLALSYFPDATWISAPYVHERAENKVLQLDIARRIGFNIPDTIVTSSPTEALKFVAMQKSAIAKPINQGALNINRKHYGFYASKVTTKADFSGLFYSPAIFQTAIDVDVDIRATVVGNKVFAATIRSKSIDDPSSHVRDWRIANGNPDIKIEGYTLPKKIVSLCIEHVKELGLKFGALDLILDKKGKYWFIENNPAGQWAFVEDETKQPIGKMLAELLMKG